MKTFDVEAPDGRIVRLQAESIDTLKPQIAAGYTIVAEAFGARKDGTGGYSIPLGGKSLLAILLEAHGDDLLAWLASKGFEPHWGGMREDAAPIAPHVDP
jgi:hypothetical protein